MLFIVGRNASAARRPHAADLVSDAQKSLRCVCRMRRPHASAAMRRPQCVGRNAADYAPTFTSTSTSLEHRAYVWLYSYIRIRNRLSLQRTAKLVFCNSYLRGKETDIDDSDSDE